MKKLGASYKCAQSSWTSFFMLQGLHGYKVVESFLAIRFSLQHCANVHSCWIISEGSQNDLAPAMFTNGSHIPQPCMRDLQRRGRHSFPDWCWISEWILYMHRSQTFKQATKLETAFHVMRGAAFANRTDIVCLHQLELRPWLQRLELRVDATFCIRITRVPHQVVDKVSRFAATTQKAEPAWNDTVYVQVRFDTSLYKTAIAGTKMF